MQLCVAMMRKRKTAHRFGDKRRTGDVLTEEKVDFSGLMLSSCVLEGLKSAGFERPSPIQLKAIPLGRCGLDLIAQAKSGTGKTCVFSVIALENINVAVNSIQVLVLAPTREIAVQIKDVVCSIGCHMKGLCVQVFIGGMPVEHDKHALKQCHIAIGTPGRIKHLIENKDLKTDSIRLFILDEADKLLDGSFQNQTNWIFSTLPISKQMLALSATYTDHLAEHLSNYMKDPTFVRLNASDPALEGIRHYRSVVPFHSLPHKVFLEKVQGLLKLLSKLSFHQCLIFSNYQIRARSLSETLAKNGWPSTYIQGSQGQAERLKAMEKLKEFKCRVLISTDLTSRGIDAECVNLVINMDMPRDSETYLHRVGRAGRFGSYGVAISFVSGEKEMTSLNEIEAGCGVEIGPLPEDISNLLSEANVRDVKSKTTTTMNGKTELEVLQVAASVSNFSNGKPMPDVHNEVELECAAKLKACDLVIEQASDVAAMEGSGDEVGMKYVGQQVDTKAAEIEVGVEKADVAEDKKELEHLATIEQQVAVSKEKRGNGKDHFTCKNNNVLDEKPSDCPEVLDEKPGQVDNLVKYGSRIVIFKENGRNKVHPVGRDGYSGIVEEKYLGREGLLEEFGNCEQSKRCFDNSKVPEKGLENEMFLTKPRDGQYPAKHFRTEGRIWNQYNTGEHLKERCGTEEQHGDYFDKEEYVEKYRGTEELHVDNSYGTEEQFTEKFSTKEHKRDLCGTEEDLADNHNSEEYLRDGHGTEEDLGDNLGCEGYLKNDCGTEVDLVHNQSSEELLRDNYGLEEHTGDHHGSEEHLRERHINNPVVFRDQTKDSDTKLVTIGFLGDSGNSNGSSCSSYEDTESESCDDEISHDQKKISISGEDLERALDAYLEANVSRKMETVEHHLEKAQRSNEETRTWIKSSRASQPEGNLSAPREEAFFSSVSKQPRRQSMTAESGRSQHLKQRMQHDHDAKEHQNKEIQYEYEHDVTASGRMYDVNKQRRRILSNGNAVPGGFRENGQDSENNFYGASADDVTAYLSALPDHWKQNWYKAYERQTKLISAYTELYRHAFH